MDPRRLSNMAQDHQTVKVGFSVTNHYSDKIRPRGRELLSAYLESLEKSCKYPFEVFIVDNQSKDRLDESKLPDHYHYRYVEDQSIGGLTHAWNLGIYDAYSRGCDIILNTNEDLTFNETINNFIAEIANHKHKDVSLYGPMSDGVPTKHQLAMGIVPIGENSMVEATTMEWDSRPYYSLNGFFYGFTREMYERFRYDHYNMFSPLKWCSWNGQEIEIHDRCVQKGMRSFIVKSCWVPHIKLKAWQHFRSC